MHHLKRLITPQKIDIIFTITISLFLLFCLNIKRFWLILGGDTASMVAVTDSWENLFSNLLNRLDRYIRPDWMDILVWIIIGYFSFLTYSLITTSIKTIKTQRGLTTYHIGPKGRRRELLIFLTKIAVRLTGLAVLILFFLVFSKYILPFSVTTSFTALSTMSEYSSWLWLAISVIYVALSLHLFMILGRLVALRTRLF